MRRSVIGILAAVCLMVVTLGPAGASAQQGQQPTAASSQGDPNERVGNLDFPGGTVAEYVAAVEKEFGPFNKVLTPEAAAMRVQPMKFTGASFLDVMRVLESARDPEGRGTLDVFKVRDTDIWKFGFTPFQGLPALVTSTVDRSNIKFPGGTVAEYVAAVVRCFPGANIAVAPGVESVRVAPVELTKVNINEAVFALPTLCESPVSVDWFGNTAMVDGVAAKKRQGDSRPTILKVWSMAEVLSQIKSQDALSAVQVALDLAGPGAEVKFHADASLLMVRGSPEQIDAVQQTINRLESNAAWMNTEQSEAGGDAQKVIRELSSDRDRLIARVAELEEQLQRMKAEARPTR